MITYRDLKKHLDKMTDDELDNALVRIMDENGRECYVSVISHNTLCINRELEKPYNPMDW